MAKNLKKKVFEVLSKNKSHVLAHKNKYIYDTWLSHVFPLENIDTVKRHISEFRSRLRDDYMDIKERKNKRNKGQIDITTPNLGVDETVRIIRNNLTHIEIQDLIGKLL